MRQRSILTVAATAAAILTLCAAPAARAQEVDFTWSTTGCFGTTCTPSYTDYSGHFFGWLDFDDLHFQGVTDYSARTSGGDADITLGSFSWHPGSITGDAWASDVPFLLAISFTQPNVADDVEFGGIADGDRDRDWVCTSKFLGVCISGYFRVTSDGSVTWSSPQQNIMFTNPNGSFTLTLNDVDLSGGDGPHYLTGRITNAAVTDTTVTPEPVSMALLGTGLAGVVGARRRKKQAK